MTSRLRNLFVALVAATALAAAFTMTPAALAGITYNFLD
jgi:hypothetical protein